MSKFDVSSSQSFCVICDILDFQIMFTLKLVVVASVLLCAVVSNVVTNSDAAGSGCEDFVAYLRGGASGWPPIVLSAPHGGHLSPSVIPDRDAGCWIEAERRCEYSHTCGVKNSTR